MGNSSDPGRLGDGELAGLSRFFVVAGASARLYFPNSDTARNPDRLAVYSKNLKRFIVAFFRAFVIRQKVK